MATSKSVAIILASTRNPRVGPHVADFVKETLASKAAAAGIALPIVDVADFKLPVFDEPVMPGQIPAAATFVHEHSRAWSAEIAKHDGFVFVSPEYNYSVPGGVKNAIDYLKHELEGKPAGIVTYGIFGGQNASDVLQHVLSKMGLRVADTRPQLAFAGNIGPDLMAAAGGTLGPATKKKWEADEAAGVVKVLDEITSLFESSGKEKPASGA